MSYRTKTCGELNINNVGEEVTLAGFIQKIREMGFMTFVDLRDHYGITQVIFDNTFNNEIKNLTTESTIQVKGKVLERSNKNKNIPTGDIEVLVSDFKILGKCKANLPFEINENYKNNKEDLRLEYRFLDLRNEEIHNNIVLRSKILKDMRNLMDKEGFVEIQTPIFANSSPEGARDYLIPSRLHPGEFYALPQAPQQFKQLLMVSGFDKYYQIAPCFRDEDPRADRSPCEFYQLDFEMAFAEQEDVLQVMENVIYNLFKLNTDKEVSKPPFKQIKYNDAMEIYGIDKPDLRNPLINVNVTDELNNIPEIEYFKDKYVYAIKVNKLVGRKIIDNITQYAKEYILSDVITWFKKENNEILGAFSKNFKNDNGEELLSKLENKLGKIENDNIVFIMANEDKLKIQKMMGLLRIKLGEEFELIDTSKYELCFIIDFPMYELNDDNKIDFAHNPFSMPKGGLESLENMNPLEISAYQYDLVCNGYEIASGAVRNHDIQIMKKAFMIAGYGEEEIEKRFKALYNAFQYGAPPHAGAAPGVDRIVMLLAETNNIREIIAFPKNKKARDLLTNSPSRVTKEQLDELHISVIEEDK